VTAREVTGSLMTKEGMRDKDRADAAVLRRAIEAIRERQVGCAGARRLAIDDPDLDLDSVRLGFHDDARGHAR
jgi:hypothetical protein